MDTVNTHVLNAHAGHGKSLNFVKYHTMIRRPTILLFKTLAQFNLWWSFLLLYLLF